MPNGEYLYLVYAQHHANNDCEVDPWEDLDERDQAAWDAVAAAAISASREIE